MGIVDEVAIAAAERVERAGGARAGLYAWRKLADRAASAETRGRGILAAWRCARELRDVDAIHKLAAQWETVDANGERQWDAEIIGLCRDLARRGLLVPATAIAHAEVRRRGSALARYLYARCLDVAGDRRAADAFADAIAQGESEGAGVKDLVSAARVRRAAWLARAPETLAAAVEEAGRVEARDARPAERLVLATVMLRAPSRFARAGAIGVLDELVAKDSPLALPETRTIAARALRAAARYADEAGEAMTPLETDRLLALLAREPIAKETARAREAVRVLSRIGAARGEGTERALGEALEAAARAFPELEPLHRRARDIVAGRVEVPAETAEQRSRPTWDTLLDAAAAMRDHAPARAAHALRTLAEREERGLRVPAQAWSVTAAALASEAAELRGVAGRLAAAMLAPSPGASASRCAPPFGWLPVALALTGAGFDDLATHARRLAALAKEPGADEALAVALTRAGWQLARAGERKQAIARLREARALAASRSAR
jgi:hypothetical protein